MSPRIRPVAEPHPPATAELIHHMTAPGRPTLALFTTPARNTTPADAAHRTGSHQLSRRLSLSLRDREIVIDRTCARLGCGACMSPSRSMCGSDRRPDALAGGRRQFGFLLDE